MNGDGHRETTNLAFSLLKEIDPEFPLQNTTNIHLPFPFSSSTNNPTVGDSSAATDFYQDVELVDVEGSPVGNARDNPHSDEWDAIDDKAHYKEGDYAFTAFNHFIDIRKGKGLFDDFDGYSYERGSGSKDQHEHATEAAYEQKFLAGLLVQIINYFPDNIYLDEGLMWWYNDEYVHAPGQEWYRGCSNSVENYSYFMDRGVYSTVEEEAVDRFPRAQATGLTGEGGVPKSVFMPVDNLARYWFNRYKSERRSECLGPVMHAVQDASIPHHAAGCIGNWHGKYEAVLGDKLTGGWLSEANFKAEAKALFLTWMQNDRKPPGSLNQSDWGKIPMVNWSIDMLVTWIALNAYHEYSTTYGNFQNGFNENESSMRDLAKKAVAMSMLCICKAADYSFESMLNPKKVEEPALWLILQ
jgi:hypothetical protein